MFVYRGAQNWSGHGDEEDIPLAAKNCPHKATNKIMFVYAEITTAATSYSRSFYVLRWNCLESLVVNPIQAASARQY
jgi:hypothetical protein